MMKKQLQSPIEWPEQSVEYKGEARFVDTSVKRARRIAPSMGWKDKFEDRVALKPLPANTAPR